MKVCIVDNEGIKKEISKAVELKDDTNIENVFHFANSSKDKLSKDVKHSYNFPDSISESTMEFRNTREAVSHISNNIIPETVSVKRATEPMRIKCEKCTYTCNTAQGLKEHEECHGIIHNGFGCKSFVCKICKMSTDDKLAFRSHLAHHPGYHMVRLVYNIMS